MVSQYNRPDSQPSPFALTGLSLDRGIQTEAPVTDEAFPKAVIGRINPPAQPYPIRGEGVQLKLIKTSEGVIIMRADHIVRDFLEEAHREMGEILKGASGSGSRIGFTAQEGSPLDVGKLEGLINRAGLFMEAHSSARFDGFGPSLVVRNVASEGLKIFEHLRLATDQATSNGSISAREKSTLLAHLIEVRGTVRSLIHHFDTQMLQYSEVLQRQMQMTSGDPHPAA